MPTNILIRLEIPFTLQTQLLVFHRWLPSDESEALVWNQDKVNVRLWLDRKCSMLAESDLAEIGEYVNIPLIRIYTDVEIQGMDDQLAEYIYELEKQPTSDAIKNLDEQNTKLAESYLQIGQHVLHSALSAHNRLSTYVRIVKGQYWLEEYALDFDRMASDFASFRAKARIGNREWVKWRPTSTCIAHGHPVTSEDLERYITKSDWQQAQEFLNSQTRPNLVLELLANAETLENSGYRRSALIEVVAALEVATARFIKAPKWEAIMNTELTNRLDKAKLQYDYENLGFSKTIRYFIPLLISEELLPRELLKQCQRAIEIRGNVVHQGQRDVGEEVVLPQLKAVRKTCAILSRFTED